MIAAAGAASRTGSSGRIAVSHFSSRAWRRPAFFFALSFFSSLSPAHAWWAASHMVCAQIAHDRLSPGARAEADRLIAVLAGDEPRADHFVPAAAWLDQIKKQGFAGFETWHFVNLEPNAGNGEPIPPPGDHVVSAIEHSLETLGRKDAGDFLRAFSLRILIHLVADAHQPLHCVNRFDARSPAGDFGGNTFPVRWPSDPKANLHILWDDSLGLYPQLAPGEDWRKRIPAAARELQEMLPPEKLPGWRERDPRRWALESHRLALEVVYPGIRENEPPSPEYLEKGREVVRQRLALAAYRLADLLETVLGP